MSREDYARRAEKEEAQIDRDLLGTGHSRLDSQPPPTDRVEEIRERVEKAAGEPWFWPHDNTLAAEANGDAEGEWLLVLGVHDNAPVSDADAALIANAPSDIRFLLSEIQRLREVEEAAKGLSRDMHMMSSRPCASCAAMTDALGWLFGCDEFRRQKAALLNQ